VGDPHVRPSNIDESNKLFAFISELAIKEKADRIELLGDLMHTHSVLRLEVVEFWDNWLDHLSDICNTVVLVGNHDMSGDYNSSSHGLSVFFRIKKRNLQIAQFPLILGPIGYISYMHDQQAFINIANDLANKGVKALVCHQTIVGSKFETGMYAPDGIDSNLINIPLIISGHIHAQQEFGKVIYPGTARWDSASDANHKKGIWIYEHDDLTGAILNKEFFSTETVCEPILTFTWSEGSEMPIIPENARVSVECIGSSAFVAKAKVQLKGKVKIKSKITDKAVRENRKASVSVLDFLENTYKSSVDKEKLKTYLKEKQFV
jgi:DNA repair exonuclease SbcCD nuclease subunit